MIDTGYVVMKVPAINNIETQNIHNATRAINNEMPSFVKYLNKFRTRMGERQDIFINAVGTGIVAPIFIKFNPISKEDKNTKSYSAIRQTAMTIAGIVIQAGIAIPLINKYLNRQIERGKFGEKFDANVSRIEQSLKSQGIKGEDLLQEAAKILKDREANIRGFKRIANLIAVFAVIPVTCAVMNKTYPVFMDKFFPKIANAASENKKSEVQNG